MRVINKQYLKMVDGTILPPSGYGPPVPEVLKMEVEAVKAGKSTALELVEVAQEEVAQEGAPEEETPKGKTPANRTGNRKEK